MPSVWADSVEAEAAANPPPPPPIVANSGGSSGAPGRPNRSTYVPPHLRNRGGQGGGGGGGGGTTVTPEPAPPMKQQQQQHQHQHHNAAMPQSPHFHGASPRFGSNAQHQQYQHHPHQYQQYAGPPHHGYGYHQQQYHSNPGTPRSGGSNWAPPSPSFAKGWENPGYANGRSWGGGGGGRRDREVNPFAEEEASEVIFNNENTGINFDAYDDIPVEASGENIPPAITSFADVDLGPVLNENIRRCKFVKPTPVQKHAIPISLHGRDLMACAQTGSGKTAAFCFPIIAGILWNFPPGSRHARGSRKAFPLALILSPTRELSSQIHDEAKKFAYQTGVKVVVIYGGTSVQSQLKELERGVDILVATPGRLDDLMQRGRISLSLVRYLALDEADRMLDMGFEPQIRKIVENTDMPPAGQRQTMLFSATFPREIQRLAADFLYNYIFLAVGRVGSSTDLIVQRVEYVHDVDKRSMLMDMIHAQKPNGLNGQLPLILVFVETKRGADSLEDWLIQMGISATTIHGDRTQVEREHALRSFRTGVTPILVATDVAARGLDIPHVAHVINYDLPSDIDDYVHRIGRTGRAGKSGFATAFFTDKDTSLARPLVDLMQEANQQVPEWLASCAAHSNFGRSHRSGSRFGGRDYRKKGGRGGGHGYGHGHGHGYGGHGGHGHGYGGGHHGASSAWDES
ncbi:DEAD-box ATP-dependent RNA helicase 37 [Selaginella moellendorffii]|nr:DEAD-box ATP-dependent RNA helicase 37 [Selaginella moellendorffii]|eukprot:XP_002973432.2 DEAD-box ATP-dependent RNA helicase 37 [Selaginella moellendorffii]